MALNVGSRLGPYAVSAKIGEGGMGEVYRAKDTKLDRDVALKVLPEAFTQDPDRLARFEREAKVLASLNHPNIAAIYGLEEAEGIRALVLELVEGPTLADRIKQGAIPLDEALPIAKQIAEALEAAHEAGVIHRDLKPANIKVRDDGTVKVLDFGLAKALDPNPEGDPSQSPTLTAAATQMGVIMGTAAYMSPEQARGKPVDKRADIWAFGCVLYEMLTGKMAFHGEDVSLTLASVMKSDLNVTRLPPDVPATVRTVLRRCLEKDPKQRVHDIADVRLAMAGAFETTVSAPSEPFVAPTLSVWQRHVTIAVAVLAALAVGGFGVWSLTRPAPRPVSRALLTQPPFLPTASTFDINVALTPDGTRVVYRGLVDGQPHLFVRPLATLEATPLTGLGGNPRSPFISPDGGWVGFFDASGGLQRVSILGGPPVAVANIPTLPRGASWGPDDAIIFATMTTDSGLFRVPMGGGELEVLTTPDLERGELNHLWPETLPGGKAVLFTILTSGGTRDLQIAVLSLESGHYDVLFPGGGTPRYVPTGHIVYGVGGTLRAVGFDLDSLTVTSDPVPIVEDVFIGLNGAANFDLSNDGSLVYITGAGGDTHDLVWVDREGQEMPVAGVEPDRYLSVRLSPDGRRLAFSLFRETGNDIWTVDIARGTASLVTTTPNADEHYTLWTADGEHLVFQSNRNNRNQWELFRKRADGTGEAELLLSREDDVIDLVPESVMLDGTKLFFSETRAREGAGLDRNIGVLDLERGEAEILIDDDFESHQAAISPDGRWLAYSSDLSGVQEVYVVEFPCLGGREVISINGGGNPVWSADGTELFYMSLDGRQVLSVPVTSEAGLTPGTPRVVFEGSYRPPVSPITSFHMDADGERFVAIKAAPASQAQLVLVQNWFEELKRLVPTE